MELQWLAWAPHCRLEPVVKTAGMIREHLWGIAMRSSFAPPTDRRTAFNSRIKTVKVRSRGFRNRQRFANAILFHLGGLDLLSPMAYAHDLLPTRKGEPLLSLGGFVRSARQRLARPSTMLLG